jgi:hypothetical protein
MMTTHSNDVESRPVNGRPTTLAEIIDDEARAFRAQGTPAASLIAETLERLSQLVAWTGASTPQEHIDRMAVWDDELRQQWFDRGYSEGLEAGRRSASRHI